MLAKEKIKDLWGAAGKYFKYAGRKIKKNKKRTVLKLLLKQPLLIFLRLFKIQVLE
jgi:hypothetical protein